MESVIILRLENQTRLKQVTRQRNCDFTISIRKINMMSPSITKKLHADLFIGEKCVGSRNFYVDNPSQLIYNQIKQHFTTLHDIDLESNTLQMFYINSEKCIAHCSCDDDIFEGLMNEKHCLNMTLKVITSNAEFVEDNNAMIREHTNS